MKPYLKWIIPIVGCTIVFATWYTLRNGRDLPPELITVPIQAKDLLETISSTGTIQAKGTVEVGTQVSGTVAQVSADYNDNVKAGSILVVLDQSTLKASLDEADAQKARAEAQMEKSKSDFERAQKLFDQGHISEKEFSDSRSAYLMDQASVKSTDAGLRRAHQNLSHAIIRSPIRGTVLKRSVEVGQTVAASLSSPVLFVIAEDLSMLEIIAGVDESDISQIHAGQEVRFSVQAYPDSMYSGKVRQIRLQPETVQNVVTYQVVIDARNPHGTLLPGMTATVDFVIHKAEKALCVPSASLRFQPSLMPNRIKEEQGKTIWVMQGNGRLESHLVETGITDGNCVELLAPKNLKVGDKVVIGEHTDSTSTKKKKNSSLLGFGSPPSGRPPH